MNFNSRDYLAAVTIASLAAVTIASIGCGQPQHTYAEQEHSQLQSAAVQDGLLAIDNALMEESRAPAVTALVAMRKCLESGDIALDLSSLKLEDVPPQITHLTHIKILHLNKNNLTSFPEELEDLTELRVLSAKFNKLREISHQFRNLQHLKVLGLSHNELTTLPDSLVRLTALHILEIDHNPLTDQSVEVITPLKQLRGLIIGKTQFSQSNRERLRKQLPDCTVHES